MKNLKIILPLLLAATMATAQEKKEMNEEQRQEFIDQLKSDVSKLSLTEDQKAPFMEITKKYGEKAKEVNANTQLEKIQKLKEIKALRIAKDDEVKALLTAEQFKVYQEIREERKERRRK
ncbi:hypothetical protein [Flavobacterium pallidum]|uniref:DUF4890 domain-containing protein n=1 Tax=Flavobacterium pallidum TaxID=2172098 RepID=A0A2S1SJG4_9FLAO|nr:hypothetical protein [Flavobacterium pallidum]AWI26535.1 hypothetical protein HYN49_11840 [Flavobacterium pallidum]